MSAYEKGVYAFFRKCFAIFAIIQGITWIVLSILSIVFFFVQSQKIRYFRRTMINRTTSFIDLISWGFYEALLDRSNIERVRILIPKNFQVISWIYLALSILWVVSSSYELYGLLKKKSPRFSNHNLMTLGFLTVMISLMDLTVFSLATVDYRNINTFDYSYVPQPENNVYDFQADVDLVFRYRVGRKIAYGVLMTLVARGFLIWVYNCVAGVLLITWCFQIFQLPSILQYDDTIPRPKIYTNPLLGKSNPSFVDSEELEAVLKVPNSQGAPPRPFDAKFPEPQFLQARNRLAPHISN